MDVRSGRGIAFTLGAAAGAVVAGGFVAGPVARADDIATLPVPPFDKSHVAFDLPGTAGAMTNDERVFIPLIDDSHRWDQAYTLSDGSYEVHHIEDQYGPLPLPFFITHSDQVVASDGVAPAVGTEWDSSYVVLSNGLATSYYSLDTHLTTSAGIADVFMPVLNWGWENDFYYGPAGTFDYIVNIFDGTVTPIFEFPTDGASAAAADFGTMWSDLVATL